MSATDYKLGVSEEHQQAVTYLVDRGYSMQLSVNLVRHCVLLDKDPLQFAEQLVQICDNEEVPESEDDWIILEPSDA